MHPYSYKKRAFSENFGVLVWDVELEQEGFFKCEVEKAFSLVAAVWLNFRWMPIFPAKKLLLYIGDFLQLVVQGVLCEVMECTEKQAVEVLQKHQAMVFFFT